MPDSKHRCVADPPPKPLMLFDGDCDFCRRWIERWREITADRVDYRSSQEAGAKFPEIAPAEFRAAVHFIETNGTVYRGAEAVFRSLGHGRGRQWLAWGYDKVPGFAAITEVAYSLVAKNRGLASAGTRFLWGNDVRRPTYFAARRGFLQTLGLIYLIAFISIWSQVDGLMGEHGITPAGEIISAIRNSPGAQPWRFPTLCWWSSSDTALHLLCLVGTMASTLLTLGLLPLPALIVCFVSYLSLMIPGEFFFSYQWDILLLETGFVALFLAPLQWRLRRGHAAVSGIGLFLAKALLFKLMFMSGVVKLTSGDPAWLDLTALDYHYWTQPLPTVFAWFADKNPEWLKKFSVAAVLLVEIVVPFFIWAPRRLRVAAACLLLILQLVIAFTGNYCFFNLLTIALCLLLVDDASFGRRPDMRKHVPPEGRASARRRAFGARLHNYPGIAALILTFPLNAMLLIAALKPEIVWPRALREIRSVVEPFYIANGYGLFRVMTRDRPEIIFEGSTDAFDWQPYEFKWKPGDLKRAPQWNAPHQPRLDWSMWFAALGSQRDRLVAERFAERLLENEPTVLRLLAVNPFPNEPPQFIRASLYEYRFTTSAERKRTGDWWQRKLRRSYLPILSLKDFQR